MSKSLEYWINRNKDFENRVFKNAENISKTLTKSFKQAYKDIESEIYSFYVNYAKDNKITLTEAKKRLNSNDFKEFQETLERWETKYKKFNNDTEYNKYLQSLKKRSKLQRLESLQFQINSKISEIAWSLPSELNELFLNIITESSLNTKTMLSMRTGEDFFKTLPEKAIKEILDTPWDGEHFSDSIWLKKDVTIRNLKKSLQRGLIRGWNPKTTAKYMRKQMLGDPNLPPVSMDTVKGYNGTNSLWDYTRLIRTETKYMITKADLRTLEENKIKGQIRILINISACKKCQQHKNKIIKVEEAIPGVNIDPFHSCCRDNHVFEIEGIDYIQNSKGEDKENDI